MTDQAVRSSVPGAAATGEGWLGRERELEELRADVERAGLDTLGGRPAARARVLLIAGQPGSGRTALAEEFARQVSEEYPGGVVRAALTEPGGSVVPLERVARQLLEGLGVPAPAGTAEDELLQAVRAAVHERRALLLLDEVAAAEQLLELVPDHRGALVVATAEGPLTGVPDVRPCTIGGLDPRSAVTLLSRRAGSEIRITVDPTAARRVAELCGMQPAALILVGGWLAAHPQVSVLEAARALAVHRDEPRALVRAFRLVMDALPRNAARLARLLPLAPAGFVDAQLVSGLAGCSLAAARAALEDFARLGLLRPVGAGAHTLPACLHPLLLEVAEREERPADLTLARARMWERTVRQLRACWAITEPPGSSARTEFDAEPAAIRFVSEEAAERWLRSRLPALMAAAREAVADGELDTLARRLIAGLAQALAAHRSPGEVEPDQYRLHELVLRVAERRELHAERSAALLNLGDLDVSGGRPAQALPRYRAALEAARRIADEPDRDRASIRSMTSLGGTYGELGDWARAADWYGRALVLVQTGGDIAAGTALQARIGAVQMCAGQWTEALAAWRAAASGHRRLRDAGACAHALSEVARAQEYAGRPYEALRTCQEALKWAEQAGDRRMRAALHLRLADTLDRLGEHGTAQEHRASAEPLTAADRPVEGSDSAAGAGDSPAVESQSMG
ncbi:tetratricopeptide repeat protein [Streptomyces sp. XM4193]|uniref:tetratricopeptide repeat protein n=1 Tax=Streptomyces sp. XM4193 TaxID=2929782 RepID=UPI001FF8AD5E|nr:tetratricopeptide repeat protein [Streptomyces sp. XM4193]MCK1799053.1 tetratricopeptide repeat protein [Streptomyces sp. XM4193]